MLKVVVGYPTPTEEFVIVERMTGDVPRAQQVISTSTLLEMQRLADRVFVDPALMEYASALRRRPANRRRMGSGSLVATSRSGPAHARRSTSSSRDARSRSSGGGTTRS
jgi:MoxR-like ATPase